MNKQQLENIWEQAKSIKEDEALKWLVRQTHTRTNHARMLVGAEEGAFLELFVEQVKAQKVLELGTFTGYSAIRLARGLQKNEESEKNEKDKVADFHVDAVEINDELEDLIREGFERAGVTNKIDLHFTDAKIFLKGLNEQIKAVDKTVGNKKLYDIVFIDANKREYCEYYDLFFNLVRPGGFILADDVLWSGKIFENPMPQDKQTLGIASFNDKIATDTRVESVILPIREGINLIRKK